MIRHKLFLYLTIWFLISQLFPPYSAFVPIRGALALVVYCAGAIVLFPSLIKTRSIIWLSVYGVITYILFLSGNAFFETINDLIVPLLSMYSSLIMIEYVLKFDIDYKLTKIIVIESVILNAIMCIITIPQLFINPNLMRMAGDLLASGTTQDLSILNWMMSYGNIHGLPMLIAPITFLMRNSFHSNKIFFFIWFTIWCLFMYMIFKSNATTPFIVALMMAIMGYLFYGPSLNNNIILKGFMCLVLGVLFLNKTILVSFIDVAQSLMSTTDSNYGKMDEIRSQILYGDADGDLGARNEMYSASQDLFFESPLFGTDTPEKIGHHSYILDRFALLGIIFIIPLIFVFFYNFKSCKKNISDSLITYYVGLISFLMLLWLKNEFGSGTWLYGFALLPTFCRYIDTRNN